MQLFKLNKAYLVCCLLLLLKLNSRAQEAINNVRLQKISASTYRINYRLNPVKDYTYRDVSLKIYRRRGEVIEEIFSGLITPSGSRLRANQTYSYNWKPDLTRVKDGDELQAKVSVSYGKPAVAKAPEPQKPNISPKADAGSDIEIELPYQDNITLDGIRSYDEDGRIIYINWVQLSGPSTLLISSQHSYKTAVAGTYKEGTYVFEITVTDDDGVSSTDRVSIIMKPSPYVKPAPQASAAVTPRRDSTNISRPAAPVADRLSMPKLRGGPANAFLDLLLPGVGHYYVSGDHYGNDRKPAVLLITALYAGSVGGAVFYKLRSNKEYNKYIDLANFREYQKDADGNIIGVRGANQAVAERYLADAKNSRNNSLILAGVSIGIMGADAIYTFIRGSKNKKAWEAEAKAQIRPFIFSDGYRYTAGLRVNF